MTDNRTPIVGMVYRGRKGGLDRLVTGIREWGHTTTVRTFGHSVNISRDFRVLYKRRTQAGWGTEMMCYENTWLAWASRDMAPEPMPKCGA